MACGWQNNEIEPDRADDLSTTTRFKLGCNVIFGAGVSVQSVVTAFESYTVLLHGLPSSITHIQLIGLAEEYGGLKSVILIPARDG